LASKKRRARWLALGALLSLSCFDPEIKDGQYTCEESLTCPEGQECQADCVCRSPDSEPPAGSPTDCENIE
jgi:hypothetical protein